MRKLIIILLLAATAFAETAGDAFPLTNTRYGITGGFGELRTNGTDALLFWKSERNIHVTKIVEGQNRAGEVVFERATEVDAAWTGTHFLAVTDALDGHSTQVIGRVVDADGHPDGEPFLITTDAQNPRIAAGHGAVLLVYTAGINDTRATRALLLRTDGRAAVASSITVNRDLYYAVTATASGFAMVSSDGQRISATTFDAQGRVTATVPNIARTSRGEATLTAVTHGTKSLLVWSNVYRIESVLLDDNGTVGAPLTLEAAPENELLYAALPSAVWNGAGWSVAYQTGSVPEPRVRVVHLDPLAQRIVSREESAPPRFRPSLAVVGGKVLANWTRFGWSPGEPAWLDALPLAESEARAVTFGAAEQVFLGGASSANGMLAVWNEIVDGVQTTRAGLRNHAGQWTEQELFEASHNRMLVKSDGRNFVIFRQPDNASDTEAVFLDENGRPTGQRVVIPGYYEAAAWNGRHWALIAYAGAQGRLLAPDGTVSAAVPLALNMVDLDIASNGDGFVVSGGTPECQFLLCYASDSRAVRLDASLQRVGAELQLAGFDPAGVVWNGKDYVVVSESPTQLGISRVSPSPDVPPSTMFVTSSASVADIAPIFDGVAVLDVRPTVRQVLFYGTTSGLRTSASLRDPLIGHTAHAELHPLAGDDLGYATSRTLRDAPHYGASRVMMGLVAGPRLARPGPPQVTVREESTRFLVQWTAPSGTVNGYRLEHRVDDGSWIELERWFGPGEQSISLRRPSYGSKFAVRVRAFNDSGTGAYSNEASPVTRRRRAVR
jgi:Fibronectin type III domain